MTLHPLRSLCLFLTVLSLGGCTRQFYRTQADEEVACIVDEKAKDPRWQLDDFSILPDPRARFYDPHDPDFTPMPPDDPSSHCYMHKVDGKNGYPWWHSSGETPYVENPAWMQSLPLDDEGVLVIDADQAVEIALIHSRNYQQNLEELYLSALDVTFERFRFDAQFFAGWQAFYDVEGRLAPGSGGRSSSRFSTGTFPFSRGIRMNRLTTSGGEFVVGLANSMVWEFAGNNTQSATTLIDFALVQPLLRGGGRDRVLERLTLSERQLLANVRIMQRYRQEFYVDILTGRNAGQGPQRRGGVFGSGLEGFSGVGGSGFGTVATGNQINQGNAGVTGGAGAAQAGGFMGLLQQQQVIRNQEANIASLRGSLAQLEALKAADRIDFFQVELTRQALYNAQSQLLNNRTAFQNQLDGFKGNLGLPPTIELRTADDMLDRFSLIDPAIVPLQNRIAEQQVAVGNALVALDELADKDEQGNATGLTWSAAVARQLRAIRAALEAGDAVREEMLTTNLERAHNDLEAMRSSIPQRQRDLERLKSTLQQSSTPRTPQERAETEQATQDAGIFDLKRLERLPVTEQAQLQALVAAGARQKMVHDALIAGIDDLLEKGPDLAPEDLYLQMLEKLLGIRPAAEEKKEGEEAEAPLPNVLDHLSEISVSLLELSLIQARLRVESIVLKPIDMTSERAIEIARDNRLDWMNARASLVDSWRLIEFNADNLESDLDLVISGDMSNVGSNPLALRDETGRLRVGLQFDSPITRLSERNTYRQALIEYQQARRAYYNFEDTVKRSLRTTLRSVDLNQVNFELRRAAVHVAVAQVELSRLRLQEPPRPSADPAAAGQFSNTTARDLVSALSDLLNVQNDFLSVWVNYEVQRRSLDLDLGTMQLDERGIWIDPEVIGGPGYGETSEPIDTLCPELGSMEGLEEIEPRRDFPRDEPPQVEPEALEIPEPNLPE